VSVKVEAAEKIYKLGENEVHALKGVNMELRKGEFVAFIGPSGSGKTTLLNLIGVLDKPTEGKIFVDGIDLTRLKEKELTKLRRNTIGFIFQFYNLIPVLSAFENVELPMLIAGVPAKEREKRARDLLQMVGLGDRINHRPDELSGGEQQRVAIVRALANKPSIVLADEPTGDLDSKTGKEIILTLRDLSNREGATVIVVTHDPSIASMASRVFEMRDGLIINERVNPNYTGAARATIQNETRDPETSTTRIEYNLAETPMTPNPSQTPPLSTTSEISPKQIKLRTAVALLTIVAVDIVAWFLGWRLYDVFSIWRTLINVYYQDLLILIMVLISEIALIVVFFKIRRRKQKVR
jgi:putative ABC transport system ATP-binding protein